MFSYEMYGTATELDIRVLACITELSVASLTPSYAGIVRQDLSRSFDRPYCVVNHHLGCRPHTDSKGVYTVNGQDRARRAREECFSPTLAICRHNPFDSSR